MLPPNKPDVAAQAFSRYSGKPDEAPDQDDEALSELKAALDQANAALAKLQAPQQAPQAEGQSAPDGGSL